MGTLERALRRENPWGGSAEGEGFLWPVKRAPPQGPDQSTLKRPTVLTQGPEFQFLSVASCGLPGNSKQGGWFHYNSQGGAPPLTPLLPPASEWDNMILPPGGDGRPPGKRSGRWEVSPQG